MRRRGAPSSCHEDGCPPPGEGRASTRASRQDRRPSASLRKVGTQRDLTPFRDLISNNPQQ